MFPAAMSGGSVPASLLYDRSKYDRAVRALHAGGRGPVRSLCGTARRRRRPRVDQLLGKVPSGRREVCMTPQRRHMDPVCSNSYLYNRSRVEISNFMQMGVDKGPGSNAAKASGRSVTDDMCSCATAGHQHVACVPRAPYPLTAQLVAPQVQI